MNIGFDFDKIFVDYPPFIPDKLIDSLYKEKSNGVLSYRIPSKPEQFLRLLTHYSILRPPIWENIRFVKNHSDKKSDKLYLISSRFSFLKGRTESLLIQYGLANVFEGMFFNFDNKQPHMFKEEMLQKLAIDRYVDDDLSLLKFLARRNENILFYWFNDKEAKSLDSNLFAISELSDIIKR